MTYQEGTFTGDTVYNMDCTGDAVVGDEVRFDRATFSGSYRRPTFDGFELITGKIVKDSYGKERQQHTFTLQLKSGSKIRIKGRNLYKNGLFRKAWAQEEARRDVQSEKHRRGDRARSLRDARIYGQVS